MALESNKPVSKEFDNISITAFRIISMLNMLLQEPLSDDDLNEKLQTNIQGSRNLSKDTICIYINTLRAIGCEISRPSKKNEYKYVLKTHPFKLIISNDEISTIIEVRKYISSLKDWKLVLETDDLLNKILNIIDSESKKTFLSAKTTALCREVNIENLLNKINSVEKYCAKNCDVMLVYNSPKSGEKEICLKAEKITFENGSFYIWGYNYTLDETSYLRLDRIKSIKPADIKTRKKNISGIEAKFKLTGSSADSFIPSGSEKILEKNDADLIIKAKVTNRFKFTQDILSYGCDCTVLSPENIRKEIIQKLKTMAEMHKDEYVF